MLRKTYRLMQKTTSLVSHRGDDLLRLAARPLQQIGQQIGQTKAAPKIGFHACPPDVWPGVADQGRDLMNFISQLDDDHLDVVVGPRGRDQIDPSFHSFDWLHDLRTLADENARHIAVRLLNRWGIANRGADVPPFNIEMAMHRVFNQIGTFAFFAPALDVDAQTQLLATLAHELAQCKRASGGRLTRRDAFFAASTLTVGNIALHFDAPQHNRYLQQFEKSLNNLILSDGGPATRRPGDLPVILKTLINLRHVMNGASLQIPASLTHAIDRVVPALRFFRMGDGAFTVVHGTGEGNGNLNEQILQLAHMNGRAPLSLPYTGFERLHGGDATILIDSGTPGKHHHAATTAFEMSIGETRVIVNCGQHRTDPLWQDLLSATSAHSTLTLDHTDNVPHHPHALQVTVSRHDTDDGQSVEITHDGYLTRNGFTHTRRLFLNLDGNDLRGQDDLSAAIPPVMPMPYTLRFHLHPGVNVAALQSGQEAILKLGNDHVYRFAHDGEIMKIEDSVYLGTNGLPQKTRQIVITGQIYGAQKTIRWAIKAN